MIDPISTINTALSSVTDTSSATGVGAAQSMFGGTAAAPAQSFADVMGSMATDMVNSLKTSEVTSMQGMRGEADTRQVVDAVMNAEQSLQTAIAIRDKIVTAYLEIARMPI